LPSRFDRLHFDPAARADDFERRREVHREAGDGPALRNPAAAMTRFVTRPAQPLAVTWLVDTLCRALVDFAGQ
jgi:hypothetical protein